MAAPPDTPRGFPAGAHGSGGPARETRRRLGRDRSHVDYDGTRGPVRREVSDGRARRGVPRVYGGGHNRTSRV